MASGSSAAAPPARTNDTTCPGSITDERGCDMDEVIVVGDPGGGSFTGTLPGGGGSGGGEDPLGGGYDDGQQTICITCGIDNRSGGGGDGSGSEEVLKPSVEDTGIAADTLKQSMLPDCSKANQLTIKWQIKYCRSSAPTATQRQRIRDALNRIGQRGAVCRKIARRGKLYLNNGLIHLFPGGQYFYGFGDPGIVMLWDDWTSKYYDASHARPGTVPGTSERMKQDLDSILAHEFDHVILGGGHIDSKGMLTKNEKQCSGLSYPYH